MRWRCSIVSESPSIAQARVASQLGQAALRSGTIPVDFVMKSSRLDKYALRALRSTVTPLQPRSQGLASNCVGSARMACSPFAKPIIA